MMGVKEESLSLGVWVLVSFLCSSRQVIPMLLWVALIGLNGLKEMILQETVEDRRLGGTCDVGSLKKVQGERNGCM